MVTSNGYVLDPRRERLGWLAPVPEEERRDREILWGRLRRDGYLYLSAHLDPVLVNGFRAYYFSEVKECGLTAFGSDPAVGRDSGRDLDHGRLREVLFERIVPGSLYAALTSHPAIRDWFAWLFGGDVHLHRRKIIRHIRPGEAGIGTATQAHYDVVYLRGGSENVLSMWIPLGDCPVEMGGLTYLEGSHHWAMADERDRAQVRPAASLTADLPSLAEKHDARWLIADYRAGDVVVHSAFMVHAATDNVDRDRRIRLSTDIRYQAAGEPIDWRWQEHWRDDDGL